MHIPVLLNEVLEILGPSQGQVMIDATVGGGGHGIPIARRLSPRGVFLGVDWDNRRIEELQQAVAEEKIDLDQLILVCGNYTDLPAILEKERLGKADGLLIDLGFSSDQLGAGRGFNFQGPEEPLLMTYNENNPPAYAVLSTLGEKQLAQMISDLSDERYAHRIAKGIVRARQEKSIVTNRDLARVIENTVPRNYERGRISPATRTFMALRIFVNRELENLGRILGELQEIVKPGGRVVIITYHSKEDAMVKYFFRNLVSCGQAVLINRKVVQPTEAEINKNPRSRSAKLRAIELK